MFRVVVLCGGALLGSAGWSAFRPPPDPASAAPSSIPVSHPEVPSGEPVKSLPVAPMPRDPARYCGPQERWRGVVVAVTGESLTVRQSQTGAEIQFGRSPWMGSKYGRVGFMYRFDDVRVGDHVGVGYDILEGDRFARELSIDRRPGGIIPAEPNTDPDGPYAMHRRRQMDQDHEEKGAPYPPGYDPKESEEYFRGIKFYMNALKMGAVPQPAPPKPPVAPPPKLIDN